MVFQRAWSWVESVGRVAEDLPKIQDLLIQILGLWRIVDVSLLVISSWVSGNRRLSKHQLL